MKITTLHNHAMGIEKGKRPSTPEEDAANGGTPHTIDYWTLIFVDRQTGDQMKISFERDARDDIVRQLTGGIVLAGGELPRI